MKDISDIIPSSLHLAEVVPGGSRQLKTSVTLHEYPQDDEPNPRVSQSNVMALSNKVQS